MKHFRKKIQIIKLSLCICLLATHVFAQDSCNDESALNYNSNTSDSTDCLYDPYEWIQSTTQSFYVVNELLGQPCSDLGLETEECGTCSSWPFTVFERLG